MSNHVEIEWIPAIVDKIIEKHGILPAEVEECFADPRGKVRKAQQGKYQFYARTYAGRYLFVVYVQLAANLVRIITARDMVASERRIYGRK